MSGLPRFSVSPESCKQRDVERGTPIGPHIVDIDATAFVVNDANRLLTATLEVGGNTLLTLLLARDPDLMPNGMALLYQMTTAMAREVAASLIGIADQIEAAAARQVADAIARAGQRGAA